MTATPDPPERAPARCDDTYLTPTEVADLISVPTTVLGKWRSNCKGPIGIRAGGLHVRYPQSLLDQWLTDQQREGYDWTEKPAPLPRPLLAFGSGHVATHRPYGRPSLRGPEVDPRPQPSPCDDTYLTPDEFADLLKVATSTLASWRSERQGPIFIRVGVHVRYPQSVIEDWLEDREIEGYDWMANPMHYVRPLPPRSRRTSPAWLPPADDTYLRPEELADLLKVPLGTLAVWRTERHGPLFIRVGVYVRYPTNFINEWYLDREREAYEWMNT